MRVPTWERTPGALVDLLNSRQPMLKADLWTITLLDGTELRWSGGDVALTVNSKLFSLGPGLRRTRVRFAIGLEVDTMTVAVWGSSVSVNTVPLAAFIAARGFDGAIVRLERAFWRPGDAEPAGTLLWFLGKVDDTDGSRAEAELKVVSMTKYLNVDVPRDVYQSGCLNVLYDPATCKVNRASKLVTGTVVEGTNNYRTAFHHGLAQAVGYFDLGALKMTSGLNAGVSRTVKEYGAARVFVLRPWPFAVAAGDTFEIVPGCDGSQATCTTKFANKIHFRGHPLIPAPETVL